MKTILFVPLFILLSLSIFGQQNSDKKISPYDFSAPALDGKTINTAELRGKIIVLNLWFINCPNCIEEIKMLNQLVEEYKSNKGVVFLGLAVNRNADLEKFLKKNPFAYQIIPNSGSLMLTKFGNQKKGGQSELGFPVHVVIDRTGEKVIQVEGIKGVEAVKKELKKQFPAQANKSN